MAKKCAIKKVRKYNLGGLVAPEEQRKWILENHPEKLSAWDEAKTGQEKSDIYQSLYAPTQLPTDQKRNIETNITKPAGNEKAMAQAQQSAETSKVINQALATGQGIVKTAGLLAPAATTAPVATGATGIGTVAGSGAALAAQAAAPTAAAGTATGIGTVAAPASLGITGGGAGLTAAGTAPAATGAAGTAAGTSGVSAGTAGVVGAVATPLAIAAAAYALGSTGGNMLKKKDDYGVNKSTLMESIGSTLHPQEDILGAIKSAGKGDLALTLNQLTPFAAGVHRNEQAKKEKKKIFAEYEAKKKAATGLAGSQIGSSVERYNEGFADGGVKGGKIKGPGTAKSDSIKTSLPDGSFIVPAENAKAAEILRTTFLGNNSVAKLNPAPQSGTLDKVSNGEHIFTPQEAAMLTMKGVNLNMLAPNANLTASNVSSMEFKNGGNKETVISDIQRKRNREKVESELKKNKHLQNYLNYIASLESSDNNDIQKALIGKNPKSTATGIYQFLTATRDSVKNIYGIDAWKADKKEQDLAAAALILERKTAFDSISKGDYDKAHSKLNDIWTSLPGGKEEQNEERYDFANKQLSDGKEYIKTDMPIPNTFKDPMYDGRSDYWTGTEKNAESNPEERRTTKYKGVEYYVDKDGRITEPVDPNQPDANPRTKNVPPPTSTKNRVIDQNASIYPGYDPRSGNYPAPYGKINMNALQVGDIYIDNRAGTYEKIKVTKKDKDTGLINFEYIGKGTEKDLKKYPHWPKKYDNEYGLEANLELGDRMQYYYDSTNMNVPLSPSTTKSTTPPQKSKITNNDPYNIDLEEHIKLLKEKGATEEQIRNFKDNIQNFKDDYRVLGSGDRAVIREMMDMSLKDVTSKDGGDRTLEPHVKLRYGSKVTADQGITDYKPKKDFVKIKNDVQEPTRLNKQYGNVINGEPGDLSKQVVDLIPDKEGPNIDVTIPEIKRQKLGERENRAARLQGTPAKKETEEERIAATLMGPSMPEGWNTETADTGTKPPLPDPQTKIWNALGGTAGLAALAQTGFGLVNSFEKRPVDKVSEQLIEGKKDAYNEEILRQQEALYGMDPGMRSKVTSDINTNRATDYAEIDAATGSSSRGFGLKRLSSLNTGKNLVDLAIQDANLKMQKKALIQSAKERTDRFRNAIAGSERQIFQDKMDAFTQNQAASSALINAGISNYIGSRNTQKTNDLLAKWALENGFNKG